MSTFISNRFFIDKDKLSIGAKRLTKEVDRQTKIKRERERERKERNRSERVSGMKDLQCQ